jgi:hypothetical protein
VGTWVAQIPFVQERFDLSRSAIGLVIAGMSIAVILALPIAGQAIVRHGSARMTWVGGGASATMDVAMNSHGVGVEQRLGRPIMSSLHAGWSFGGMTGAAFGGLMTALGLDARVAVAVASALLLAALVVSARRIGPGSAAAGEDTPRFTVPSRGVVLLAILCLLIMVTEGAMADWGALYLRQDLGTDAAVAALGFAFFTAGMTTGRVIGDWVNRRIGPVALLRFGALLTGVPLAAMLLIGAPAAAFAGFFAIGLGVANGVPLMFSAAGRQPGTAPGPGIAAVSSTGSIGFLLGPPLIGFLAGVTSLALALGVLVPAALAVLLLAGRAAGPTAAGPVTGGAGVLGSG